MNVKMGSKGRIVIPCHIRRKYSIGQGELLRIEEEDGIVRLIIPAKLVDPCGTWRLNPREVREEIEESRRRWRV